jgi:alcohol dehydrogenase class IV
MRLDFYMPRKVVVTSNLQKQLSEELKSSQIRHAFILYSKSAINQPLLLAIKSAVELIGIQSTFVEMQKGEPTIALLNTSVQLFIENHCDGVVAIGGGSAIDLAKGIAAVAKNEAQSFAQLASYESVMRYPLIAVPTTAGTGSEATKIAVITDEILGIKYNPGHPDLIPDVAILVPQLTVTVPKHITAQTGLDALTHAIEAYVSTKATELTDFYALQAIKLISNALPIAYHTGTNIEARKQMLLGSYYAGLAFSNASTNLAHAAGRALGTMWNMPHGLSVAILHPFVVASSYESCKERYDDIAQIIGIDGDQLLDDYLIQLNEKLGIWKAAACLLKEKFHESIDEMATNALSGNGILTNRKVPTKQQIQALYLKAFTHIKNVHSLQS